eukprot:14887-Heterococcus_DN1.PRE.5
MPAHTRTVLSQLYGADSTTATSKSKRSSSSPKTGSRLQARAAAAHAQDDSDPWYPDVAYCRIALCSKCGTQRAAVACAECAPLLYCLKCSALAHAKVVTRLMNFLGLIEKREHVLSQYIKPPPPPRIAAQHSLGYHVKKGHTWIANQTAIQQRQNVKVEEEKFKGLFLSVACACEVTQVQYMRNCPVLLCIQSFTSIRVHCCYCNHRANTTARGHLTAVHARIVTALVSPVNLIHEKQLRKQLLARQDAKKEAERLQRNQQALAQTSKCAVNAYYTVILEELAAAVRIQAFNRAHTARAAFTKLQAAAKQRQADITEQQHNAAAINIQRIWRAYTVKLFIATNGIELHPKEVEVDDTGSVATTGSTTTATAIAAAAVTTNSGSSDSAVVQLLAPAATVTTAAVPAAGSNELVVHGDSSATAKAEVPVHDVAADKALLRERVTKEFRRRRE